MLSELMGGSVDGGSVGVVGAAVDWVVVQLDKSSVGLKWASHSIAGRHVRGTHPEVTANLMWASFSGSPATFCTAMSLHQSPSPVQKVESRRAVRNWLAASSLRIQTFLLGVCMRDSDNRYIASARLSA